MSKQAARRWGLVGLAVSWALIGVAYLGMSDARRWQPHTVGVLAIVAAVLAVWLAVDPTSEFAYRFGGTMAVGALLFRLASVVLGLKIGADPDVFWISVSSIGTTLMQLVLYALWWLRPVKTWHQTEKRKGDVPPHQPSTPS